MQYYHMEYGKPDMTSLKAKPLILQNEKYKPKDGKKDIEIRKTEIEVFHNKWQQLIKAYPQVHISPDAESILIKPKDTVVLQEKYHELSSNSFLLHAYYNYRQLLLFRYIDSGEYYIGVPGINHERTRRIAIMFGFEGFEGESDGFGYFMKRVEI